MPRRPRKQPRASNGIKAEKQDPKASRKMDGKMKKWVRREDVQGNEEDEFHERRDHILLEGEDAEGDESGEGEEEVFGLGLESDSDGENEVAEDDAVAVDGENEGDDMYTFSRNSKERKRTAKKPEGSPSPSDTGSEESESWGRKKSVYYASNEGVLADKEGQEDEEEAYEMEEREARRLQARARDTVEDADYGFDDVADIAASDALLEGDQSTTISHSTVLPSLPAEALDRASALRHLEKTAPETLALAREWDDVARDLMQVQHRLETLDSMGPDPVSLGLSHLHHQTLLTYVTVLAFYLHTRAGLPTNAQPNITTSRVKIVLERLLELKQALSIMEELDFDASDGDDEDDDEELNASYLDEEEKAELDRIFRSSRESYVMKGEVDSVSGRRKKAKGMGKLDALLEEADAALNKIATSKVDDTIVPINGVKHSKKSKSSTEKSNLRTPTFDLVEPTFVPSKGISVRREDDGLEDYGEATALSMVDDADKKMRKRSLRFHTSKIESSARRREESREKLGGDDDIPYRERKKEKEARVRREVEKRRGEGGEDLGADISQNEDLDDTASLGAGKRKRGDDPSGEESEDGYYELVKRVKKDQKERSKRAYDEERLKERMDIVEDDAGGPRSLTRAILKNKGLTPRRSKSVRNPRVKKRERFEKAKKKVKSQKAIYKGGLSGKPYSGEESGITKVVKSVKL